MLIEPLPLRIAEPPAAESILVIAAHPDDIESWCAGTLAGAMDRGCTVTYLLLTSGEKGSEDTRLSGAAVAAVREKEQRAAAAVLGVRSVQFLRLPDASSTTPIPCVSSWSARSAPSVRA
ncbi:MAG: PIG-L family deacetylase [Chloroflexi bacterium]|nr:PIG-L family deacetylase [Chloroflexota bacterium]